MELLASIIHKEKFWIALSRRLFNLTCRMMENVHKQFNKNTRNMKLSNAHAILLIHSKSCWIPNDASIFRDTKWK